MRNNLKKIAAMFLAVLLAVSLCPTVFAEDALLLTTAAPGDAVAKDVFSNDESSAEALNKLGLFLGTDIGYELDRTITRQEAITMVVRLMGGEAEAKSKNYEHPFTDVAVWAYPYVGYAYHYGVTVGISDTEFGSSADVTYCQYLTFMLRLLNYKDADGDFAWNAPYELAQSLNITTAAAVYGVTEKTAVKRGPITDFSWAVLEAKFKNTDTKLCDTLIKNAVFTSSDYADAKKIKTGSGSTVPKTYCVTFVDFDGKQLSKIYVEEGYAATAPSVPKRDGYTFKGWDKDFSAVKADMTVTATYDVKLQGYTVTFLDYDGKVIKTETVLAGKDATAPTAPVKAGYTFTGWDCSFEKVKSNLTVKPTYIVKTEDKTYTVTFVADGKTVETKQVKEGESVTAPTAPAKEGYTFTGWNKSLTNIRADMTVTAQYTKSGSGFEAGGTGGDTVIDFGGNK